LFLFGGGGGGVGRLVWGGAPGFRPAGGEKNFSS